MDKKFEKIAIEHLRMTIARLRSVKDKLKVDGEFIIDDFEQAVDFIEKDIFELKKED